MLNKVAQFLLNTSKRCYATKYFKSIIIMNFSKNIKMGKLCGYYFEQNILIIFEFSHNKSLRQGWGWAPFDIPFKMTLR